jgi:isopentenyl-diphosphate delta-isomerase
VSFVLPEPTPEMMIDVVDGADRKIGEAPRARVLPHALNFHTVHLFVFDAQDRLLLQQLSVNRERNPLKWGASVAAYLFADESYESAIRRRALQELGIDVEPAQVGKIEMKDGRSTKFVSLFAARHDGEVSPDPEHIQAIRFAPLGQVEEELAVMPERFTPTFRNLFPFYLRSL